MDMAVSKTTTSSTICTVVCRFERGAIPSFAGTRFGVVKTVEFSFTTEGLAF
jgi:hypothetical protein